MNRVKAAGIQAAFFCESMKIFVRPKRAVRPLQASRETKKEGGGQLR